MLTQIVNLQQLYHVEHMEEISFKKTIISSLCQDSTKGTSRGN